MSNDLISRKAAIDFIKDHSYPVRYDGNSIEQGMTVTEKTTKEIMREYDCIGKERYTGKPSGIFCLILTTRAAGTRKAGSPIFPTLPAI